MSEPYNPPTAPPPGGPPAYATPGLPWDRAKTGNALVDTVKALVTAPGRAYAEMREKGDYLAPILFALILGTFGTVIGQIWQLVFGAWMVGLIPPEWQAQLGEALAPSVLGVIIAIVVAPMLWPILLFVFAGIFHLSLLIVGGTKESTAGFEGTVRAVAYSLVAHVAQVIPVLGGFWFLWSFVLCIIGLARVHHTSTGKAALAVLAPVILCCACIIFGIVAVLGGGIAAFSANQ